MSKGKVYLIDDDAGICAAVGLLLKTEGYEVDAYEHVIPFLRTIQRQTNGCAVADVRMPVMSGIELLQELKTRHIDLPVIFITGAADVPLAVKAMKLGAADFLEKPFHDETLLSAVDAAIARSREESIVGVTERLALLTPREVEVFNAVADGLQNPRIADLLGISVRTVEVHRANVMAKLEASSVYDLVKIAMIEGIRHEPSTVLAETHSHPQRYKTRTEDGRHFEAAGRLALTAPRAVHPAPRER